MNVNDFDKYISSYLDGDLSLSDIEAFKRLLRDNSECKEKLESYQIMLDELSNLESLNTSDNFLNKLHQRIDTLPKIGLSQNIEKNNFFNYNYIPIISLAAGVAMFIFSISIFTNSNQDDYSGDGTLYNTNYHSDLAEHPDDTTHTVKEGKQYHHQAGYESK